MWGPESVVRPSQPPLPYLPRCRRARLREEPIEIAPAHAERLGERARVEVGNERASIEYLERVAQPERERWGFAPLGSQRINLYDNVEGRRITLVDCGSYGHLRYLEEWLEADLGVPVFVPEPDLAVARTTRVRVPPVRLRRSLLRLSAIRLVMEAAYDGVFTQPPVEHAVGYATDATLDVPGGRLVHFPATEHEELVTAWLWSERAAVISHQTVRTQRIRPAEE